MPKIAKIMIISCIMALTLATGASVYASRIKRFVDNNGSEIVVHCNDNPTSSSKDTIIIGSETPKIGDILIVDGIKEKVIALGEDGEFITEIVK